jgi:hypothetical protein
MAPTYLFVICLFAVLAIGIGKTILRGGHPAPLFPVSNAGNQHETVSLWLLLRAFSSGCTAMTGVEAVSNGVMAFQEPRRQSARHTLTVIIIILMLLLAGIAYVCRSYGIGATAPGQAGYQSVLSQLVGAVTGKGWFYYVTMFSILLVLVLQANTAFADFPRLCRVVAQNGYLPHAFTNRGRRLVYSYGINVLAVLSGALLVIFGGVTDRLIPLFAIGAFLAFTLSQAGMVGHWLKKKGPNALQSMAINALGAAATAVTVIVIIASKVTEGAWITLLLIPALIALMLAIRRHYVRVTKEMAGPKALSTESLHPPLVVVPIDEWNRVSQKAIRFALTLSRDVVAVHIDSADEPGDLSEKWSEYVQEPARNAGFSPPDLVVLKSPYRFVIKPTLDYILDLERSNPDRQISVLVPMLVERHWYQRFLHNQRGELLTALLLLGGNKRIVIVNVPWYLKG